MSYRAIEAGLTTLFILSTGTFVLASCNRFHPGNSTSQSSGITPAPTINVADWSRLTLLTACEAMDPNSCRGAYGFTVFNDGSWTAGPSPSGKTVSGRLTAGELSAIQTDIKLFSPTDLTSDLVCTQAKGVRGRQETLQIWFGDQPHTLYQYFTPKGAECFAGDDKLDDRLLVDMRMFLQQYYPVPFSGRS